MIRLLKIVVDVSDDTHHDLLIRNANVHMCYSILNHLGFKGEGQPRSFGGKFAFLAVNVRNVVVLVTIASNSRPQPAKDKAPLSPLDESGMLYFHCEG
jgi:mediator of RNA polymerase II transcription subunit 16, fungi type